MHIRMHFSICINYSDYLEGKNYGWNKQEISWNWEQIGKPGYCCQCTCLTVFPRDKYLRTSNIDNEFIFCFVSFFFLKMQKTLDIFPYINWLGIKQASVCECLFCCISYSSPHLKQKRGCRMKAWQWWNLIENWVILTCQRSFLR